MEKVMVIIPTYNERENIEKVVRGVAQASPEVSIFVVDDNFPDKTADVVKELQKTFSSLSLLVRQKKEGLGMAYIEAFRTVLNDDDVKKIVTMDADLSHDPAYLPTLLEAGKKYDVVIGSRYIKEGGVVGWEVWRRMLSVCGNFYSRTVTGIPIKDCTSGFSVIDAEMLRTISFNNIDSSGYAFLIELKYLLFQAGASFFEVPIIFHNRTGGESKISNHIIKEGVCAPWKMIFRNFFSYASARRYKK